MLFRVNCNENRYGALSRDTSAYGAALRITPDTFTMHYIERNGLDEFDFPPSSRHHAI